MADENILRIGAEFDVAPIVAGAQQAGEAVNGLVAQTEKLAVEMQVAGESTDQIRQHLIDSGIAAETVDAALKPLAVSVEAVAVAADKVAPAMERAAAGTKAFGASAAVARFEAGALTGSTGMMVGGLSRVAASSEALAPIIQAAFPVFAAFFLIDILEKVDEALKKASDDAVGYTKAVQEQEKENVKWSQSAEASALTVADSQTRIHAITKETGEIAEQSFGQKWVKAMMDGTHATSALGAGLADPLIGFTALFSAEEETANRTVQLGKDFDTAAKQALALREEADRTALGLLSVAEAADKAARPGNRIGQLQIELNYLDQQEQKEKQIARDKADRAAIEKGAGPGGAEIAAQAAEADVEATFANRRKELNAKLAIEESKSKLDQAQATAEKIKTITEAGIAFDESKTREAYEAHRITAEEETAQLVAEENRRMDAVRAFYETEIRLAKERGAATGEDVGPKVTKLQGDLAGEEEKSKTKVGEINAKGNEEILRRDQERAIHQIQINQQVMQSDDELARHRAEVALKKADTPDEMRGASASLIEATNRAIENQIAAIEKENAVLAKDPSEAAQAKIAENLRKVHELKNQETKEDEDAAQETKDRIEGYYAEQFSFTKKADEESLRSLEDTERQKTAAYKTQFQERAISASTFYRDIEDAASQEFIAEATMYANQLQAVQTLYDSELISYKEYASQVAEIDDAIAAANRKMWDEIKAASQDVTKSQEQEIKQLSEQWASAVTEMANKVITGKATIGQAFAQMAGQIELELIDNGIKKIVQHFSEELLKLVVPFAETEAKMVATHAAGLAQRFALDAANTTKTVALWTLEGIEFVAKEALMVATKIASVAARLAAEVAAHFVTMLNYAEEAAAATWAAVAAIPVIGPFIAPIAAAAAFAAVLAFEQGGIVPGDQMIHAHDQEMVLPAPISKSLQGAVPAIQNFNATMEGSKSDSLSSIVNQSNRSESTTNQGSKRTHVEVNFNGGSGNLKHDDIIKSVRQGIRRGELRMP